MAQPQTNFEVTIEKLVYGGDGLARLDGEVVLTPFVLPGERALVEAIAQKPGLVRARLAGVIEAAAERAAPPCPYFGRCGGCHYQHANYEAQLALKRSILAETIERVGKFAPPVEIRTIAAEPWSYRNRVQLHLRGVEIGYLEARSNRLCATDRCPISSPRINQAIATIREMLKDRRWPRFVRSLELFTNEDQLQLNVLETDRPVGRRFFEWCAEKMPDLVPGALDYPAAGAVYRVSGGSFFQVNRFLSGQLVEAGLERAQGETALDLYAGVGLFSLPLARRIGKVVAVETSAGAVRDLRFNAERAGVTVEAEQNNVDAFLTSLTLAPDFVLADPPRAGLGKTAVAQLARLSPARITIVACDPATLARDLAGLIAAGYAIETMILIDLFPQTFHIETVAHLSLR
ncbi:MAG TPA: class I SAM-dependent RNA methyltransferase [Bryobacteraceae bacterium]|nr:class I SAM-dependent RNA methyltransferase [Bryobacteraceae bacterium]